MKQVRSNKTKGRFRSHWTSHKDVIIIKTKIRMAGRNFGNSETTKPSWFQTLAVFWILCAFFWVIPRRLNFICRRFGTLCLFHLHRQVGTCLWRWNRVFRNVGIENSDGGELPRRKHTILSRHLIHIKHITMLALMTGCYQAQENCNHLDSYRH